MKNILKKASLSLVCIVATSTASAGWIDWSSTTTGTLDIGGTTVGVTLSGSAIDHVDGDGYYNNAWTGGNSFFSTYGGYDPSGLIRVANASNYTLNFDQAVSGLQMALVSVGSRDNPVTYSFDDSFSVLSSGTNIWGYTAYSVSGNNFTGYEYNGVLGFDGSFNSISFSTNRNEYWHGFNFGASGIVPNQDSTAVSEPASLALLGLGLIGLAAARKKAKA